MPTQNFPPNAHMPLTPGVAYVIVNATSEKAEIALDLGGTTPLALILTVRPNSEIGVTGPAGPNGALVNTSKVDLTVDSPEVQNLAPGGSAELVPGIQYEIINNNDQEATVVLAFNTHGLAVPLTIKAHSHLALQGPGGGALLINRGTVEVLLEGLHLQNLPPGGAMAMEQEQTYVVYNPSFRPAEIGIAYNDLNLAFYAEVRPFFPFTVKSPIGGGVIQNRSGLDLQVETPEI